MIINKKKYILFLFLFSLFYSFSQEKAISEADKEYSKYGYVDAIKIYEKICKKGYKDPEVFKKLANSYYFNSNYEKAARWYESLFQISSLQDSEYYYRYGQSLKSIGNYDEANKMMQKFAEQAENDNRAKLISKNKNYLDKIKENSNRYEISDIGINSPMSDFGASFLGKQFVFTSSRDIGVRTKKISKWDNNPYNSLFIADENPDGSIGEAKLFSLKKGGTEYNETTPIFTKDGKTMYFSRNDATNPKKDKWGNSLINIKIFKAVFKDGEWQEVGVLPFCSNQYSVAHPVLSSDEKTLYFVSDMPGTLGLSDIFSTQISSDGTYSKPINLGSVINTEGKETFPFVNDENELYFASDGHPGLGGLDIFVVKIGKNNTFEDLENIGMPANSKQDDFAYYINTTTRNGYLSSNRLGGKGYDDIYKFIETRNIYYYILDKIITDKMSDEPLENSKVTLFDSNFNPVGQVITDKSGRYKFKIPYNTTFYVRGEKQGYHTNETSVNVDKSAPEKLKYSLQLEKILQPIQKGDDLAKLFDVGVLYFDLDKADITNKAEIQLIKILELMNQNSKIKIDIRAHTDSRASDAYNLKLSQRRYQSVFDWFVRNGISAQRMTGRGYGETQLINECGNGVKCTEEEHQLNRRSEFIIN